MMMVLNSYTPSNSYITLKYSLDFLFYMNFCCNSKVCLFVKIINVAFSSNFYFIYTRYTMYIIMYKYMIILFNKQ